MFSLQSQSGVDFGVYGQNWGVNVGYTPPVTQQQTALQLESMQLQQKAQNSTILIVGLVAVAALFIFKS